MKNVPNHQPVMFPNTYKNCVAVRLFWLKLMPALGLSIIGSVLSTSFNAEKKNVRQVVSSSQVVWNIMTHDNIGVSIHGDTPKRMVYEGKSIYKFMIYGCSYFRKPPCLEIIKK